MNKHSKAFIERQQSLKNKENEIRDLINKESDEAEEQLLNYLKLVGIAAAGAALFYGISKLIKGKKKKEKEDFVFTRKKQQSQPTRQSGLKDQIISKLSDQLVASLASFVTGYLTRIQEDHKKSNENTKD
jgi:hypothetical protein